MAIPTFTNPKKKRPEKFGVWRPLLLLKNPGPGAGVTGGGGVGKGGKSKGKGGGGTAMGSTVNLVTTSNEFRMNRTADLTGIPATFDAFTFSFWFKVSLDPETGLDYFWDATNRRISNWIDKSNDWVGSFWSDFLNGTVSTASTSALTDDQLYHLMVSVSHSNNAYDVWLNGVQLINDAYGTASDLGSQTDWWFGTDRNDAAGNRIGGDVQWGAWWGDDQYFSTPIGTFIDASGNYIDGGADGSGYGGSQPLIWFGGPLYKAADWNAGTNKGSGGDFTVIGGTTTDVN